MSTARERPGHWVLAIILPVAIIIAIMSASALGFRDRAEEVGLGLIKYTSAPAR